MTTKITFRKNKKSSCVDLSESFDVNINGVPHGQVLSIKGGWYFWARMGDFSINTSDRPLPDLDLVKNKCRDWIKSNS